MIRFKREGTAGLFVASAFFIIWGARQLIAEQDERILTAGVIMLLVSLVIHFSLKWLGKNLKS